MTLSQLQTACPAAFAETPDETRVSSRYLFIPSTQVITKLYALGFEAVTCFDRTKSTGRAFGQHMIRFRQLDTKIEVGEIIPEVVLYNSHDASHRFELPVGLHRVWCKNGATAPVAGQARRIEQVHLEGGSFDLDAEIQTVLASIPVTLSIVDQMRQIQLTVEQQKRLVSAFLPHAYDESTASHAPREAWLVRRRSYDSGNDIWTVMNVIQEHFERGGVQLPWGRTFGVKEPKRLHHGNTALWTCAIKAIKWQ